MLTIHCIYKNFISDCYLRWAGREEFQEVESTMNDRVSLLFFIVIAQSNAVRNFEPRSVIAFWVSMRNSSGGLSDVDDNAFTWLLALIKTLILLPYIVQVRPFHKKGPGIRC